MYVIGIDFSAALENTGMAMALVDEQSSAIEICDVCTASKRNPPVEIAVDWIRSFGDDSHVLIAIDAPLGWPDAMRCEKFVRHAAGERMDVCADKLFMRATDRQIRSRLNKTPLSVGADKIARTAHSALNFLSELSGKMNLDSLPLAWSPSDVQRSAVSVIEVYPAATLLAHNVSTDNYKSKNRKIRGIACRRIIESLSESALTLRVSIDSVARNDDTVDAVVCVLAGVDFLAGNSEEPECNLLEQAKRESWIWAKM